MLLSVQVWSSSEGWGKSASYCSCPPSHSLKLFQVWFPSLFPWLPCPTGLCPRCHHRFPQGFAACLSSVADAGWGQADVGWLPTRYHDVFWQPWCGWTTCAVPQRQHFKEVMFTRLRLLRWSGLLWVYSRWSPPLSSGSVSCLFMVVVQRSHWIYPKSHGI